MSRPPFQLPTTGRPEDSDERRAVPSLRLMTGPVFSLPALTVWLVIVTVLAAGPLQGLDRALSQPWSRFIVPDLRPFFLYVVDSMADMVVAMATISVVSLVVAWRARSVRPLVVTAGAVSSETALIVAMKLVTARPRPVSGDPSFFHLGIESATIYPSGHTANAILIYGVAVYLIASYTRTEQRTITALWWGVAWISVVTALTSLYLQWHWATDLLGGFVAGALVLRATVTLDQTYPTGVWTPLRPLLWRLELLAWRLTRPRPDDEAAPPDREQERSGPRVGARVPRLHGADHQGVRHHDTHRRQPGTSARADTPFW